MHSGKFFLPSLQVSYFYKFIFYIYALSEFMSVFSTALYFPDNPYLAYLLISGYNTEFAALHYIFQTNHFWLSLAIILEQQNKHKQHHRHQHTCRRHLVKLKIHIPVVKSMLQEINILVGIRAADKIRFSVNFHGI